MYAVYKYFFPDRIVFLSFGKTEKTAGLCTADRNSQVPPEFPRRRKQRTHGFFRSQWVLLNGTQDFTVVEMVSDAVDLLIILMPLSGNQDNVVPAGNRGGFQNRTPPVRFSEIFRSGPDAGKNLRNNGTGIFRAGIVTGHNGNIGKL